MKATIKVNFSQFDKGISATMSRVNRGSKKATIEACEEVMKESQEQVPRHSGALAESGYYEVSGYSGNFTGTVGYGGNGDPANERGEHASEYAIRVHEDLSANHPNGGKAKFLEDPIRAYTAQFTKRISAVLKQYLGL